jgi:hypothetical protein
LYFFGGGCDLGLRAKGEQEDHPPQHLGPSLQLDVRAVLNLTCTRRT